jgi:hypothetical protein
VMWTGQSPIMKRTGFMPPLYPIRVLSRTNREHLWLTGPEILWLMDR